METPKIYVADLAAYNEGKLVGEWLDLSDFYDGSGVVDAINDLLKKFSEEQGVEREEYAIHDTENIPEGYIDEGSGEHDFDRVINVYKKAEEEDLPLDVLLDYAKEVGVDADELNDIPFNGKFASESDFAYDLVEQGVMTDLTRYLYMTDTDKRLYAQDDADYRVNDMDDDDILDAVDSDIKDELDRAEEIDDEIKEKMEEIESLNDEIEELESGDKDTTEGEIEENESEIESIKGQIEELNNAIMELSNERRDLNHTDRESEVDECREILREQYYDEVYDELEKDAVQYFLDNGLATEEDIHENRGFSIDYNLLAQDLGDDYTYIDYDGDVYVFSMYRRGGMTYADGGMIEEVVDGNTEVKIGNFIFYFDGVGDRAWLTEIYHKPSDFSAWWDKSYYRQLRDFKNSHKNKRVLTFIHPSMGDFQVFGGFQILKERPTYVDGSMYAKGGMIDGDKLYEYGITYELITPESVEMGDFEETGWEVESQFATLEEILRIALFNYGIYMPTDSFQQSWRSVDADNDRDYYEKGHERYYTLFVSEMDGSEISKEEANFITEKLKSGRKMNWDADDKEWWADGGMMAKGGKTKKMIELTNLDNGKTEYITYSEAVERFGKDEFDEMLQGYGGNWVAIEVYNNPNQYAKGGSLGKTNTDRIKNLVKNLDNTPHSIGLAIMRERILTWSTFNLKNLEENPKDWSNPMIDSGMYKDFFERVIKYTNFETNQNVDNTKAIKNLIKDLDNTPYSIGIGILRERLLTWSENDMKSLRKNPKAWSNPFISSGMYEDYLERVIKYTSFDDSYADGGKIDDLSMEMQDVLDGMMDKYKASSYDLDVDKQQVYFVDGVGKEIKGSRISVKEIKYADGGMMAKGGVHKVNKKYAYFAVNKETNKIVDGFEIVDDVESLKYYAKIDLEDNDLNPKDYNILSAKTLKSRGIDPYNWDSWAKTGEYEKGGTLEAKMKKKLSESLELPMELAIYVPSTDKANIIISKKDFQNRVEEVERFLSDLFGGYSAVSVDGGYVSEDKGLIQEDVTRVATFGSIENFESNFERLINKIGEWCNKWGQESMGFEFEDDMFYIDKNTTLEKGGTTDMPKKKD